MAERCNKKGCHQSEAAAAGSTSLRLRRCSLALRLTINLNPLCRDARALPKTMPATKAAQSATKKSTRKKAAPAAAVQTITGTAEKTAPAAKKKKVKLVVEAGKVSPVDQQTSLLNLSTLPSDVLHFDICSSLTTQSVLALSCVSSQLHSNLLSSLKFWRTQADQAVQGFSSVTMLPHASARELRHFCMQRLSLLKRDVPRVASIPIKSVESYCVFADLIGVDEDEEEFDSSGRAAWLAVQRGWPGRELANFRLR